MNKIRSRGRPRLAALLLSLLASGGAWAQAPLTLPNTALGAARAAEARADPAEALARYLRVLASNPRNIEALTGAGRAALEIEDPNAAVGFYARAEELAPRDGRIKAGLGTALVQMEQPREALRLFAAAAGLGLPEGSFAADRGLAYDLSGDNRRAQADYQVALRYRNDPETVRRYATSLAISGDRAGALQLLDPLLRQQDKAAWRTRTFVHALTGDAAGASQLADSLMPRVQAAQIKPFLARLASLSAPAKAMAVHFGHFPAGAYGGASFAEALPLPGQPQPPFPPSFVPGGTATSRITPVAPQLSAREVRRMRREQQRSATVQRRTVERQQATARTLPAPSATLATRPSYDGGALPGGRPFGPQIAAATAAPATIMPSPAASAAATYSAPRPATSAAVAPVRAPAPQPPAGVATLMPSTAPQPSAPVQVARPYVLPAPAPAASVASAAPAAVAVGGPAPAPRPAAPEPAFASLAEVSRPPYTQPASGPAPSSVPAPAVATTTVAASSAGPATAYAAPPVAAIPSSGAPAQTAASQPVASPPLAVRPVEIAPSAAAISPRVYGPEPEPAARAPVQLALNETRPAAPPAQSPAPLATATANPVPAPASAPSKANDALDVAPRIGAAPVPTAQAATPAALKPGAGTDAKPKTTAKTNLPGETKPGEPKPHAVKAADAKTLANKDAKTKAGLAEAADKTKKDAGTKDSKDAKSKDEKSAADTKTAKTGKDAKDPKGTKGEKTAAASEKDEKGAKKDAKAAADDKKLKGKEPARVWVQVAGGADKAALPHDWRKLKAKHGDLLAGQSAWTTPLRLTNRLLVGPFKSFAASQEFVNKAGKAGLSSFTFTSEDGQAIQKLSGN